MQLRLYSCCEVTFRLPVPWVGTAERAEGAPAGALRLHKDFAPSPARLRGGKGGLSLPARVLRLLRIGVQSSGPAPRLHDAWLCMERGLSFSRQEEDEQDRFERMQETTLPAGPESASFYKAKMRSDQKVTSAGPSDILPMCAGRAALCPAASWGAGLLRTQFSLSRDAGLIL